MQRVLLHGDVMDEYQHTNNQRGSKSHATDHGHAVTAAVAVACARSGWSRLDFHYAILDSTARAGQHARDIQRRRGHDRAIHYLNRVWEKASTLISGSELSSRQDAIADLITLRDRISVADWSGTASGTDLRVLIAHWHIAKRSGGRMHSASYREISDLAGHSLNATYNSSQRLVSNGWMKQIDAGTQEHGSTWMLLNGLSHGANTSRGRQAGGASSVPLVRNGDLDASVIEKLMTLDAFAHRGLGTSSMKLLAALNANDSQTVKELVVSATVSPATAYRQLKRLAEHDLTLKQGEVWILTAKAQDALSGPSQHWDEVSVAVGTYGASWRRQQLHRDQRAVWYGQTLPRLREARNADVVPIRGDEVHTEWIVDGEVINPATGEVMEGLTVASDGRLIVVDDEPDYDELLRRSREAELAYAA